MALAVISVLYGALLAIGQNDIRRLIAYTSVSHFGFIVLGIFAFTSQGQAGSSLYMFNHGLSTAALFLVTGFLISRRGSKMITRLRRGREGRAVLAGIFLVAGLSSLSLPGLSPFVSEFLVLDRDVHEVDHRSRHRDARHRARRALHPADVPTHDDRPGARVDQAHLRPAAA